MALASLHHVTCVCSDAQRTAAFYRDELGFSLVKKTVNFDDPHSYHLYFGDEDALARLAAHVLRVAARRPRPARARHVRVDRPRQPDVQTEWQLEDPDGLRLRVLPGRAARRCTTWSRIGNPLLYAGLLDEAAPLAFAQPERGDRADRRRDDAPHRLARRRRRRAGASGSTACSSSACARRGVQDRKYFRSIYFRMPDGILLEIATDGPGFLVDEPRRDARHEPVAAAVARGRARDARTRARADRLGGRLDCRPSTRWWRNW